MAHLGEDKTEQFVVATKVDGKLIREQRIHDPFIHNTTIVCIGKWDLFKALFNKPFKVKVQISVRGSFGAERAIMMLDPQKLEEESKIIAEQKYVSRSCGNLEQNQEMGNAQEVAPEQGGGQ